MVPCANNGTLCLKVSVLYYRAQQNSSGGVFSFFKSLTAGRTITVELMTPVMEKMKEHLISMYSGRGQ